jgi:hypothetical protein
MTEKTWKRPTVRMMFPKKGMDYTMVKFRNPAKKGETWNVSVHGKGGGPHTESGHYDPTIPMTFESQVVQTIRGQYHTYVLVTYQEKALRPDPSAPFPKMVMKRLFNRAAAYCKRHGFVNVDPRWKQ